MSEQKVAYEARARQDYEMQTMKTGRVEAIEPRHTPSTIGESLEVLGQRIADCEKGAAVIEETLTPVLLDSQAAMSGALLKNAPDPAMSPILAQMLALIAHVEDVEFKLRTVCNRVQL